MGALEIARRDGYANVITFDMGGTTAKAALIEAGRPSITSEFEVGAGIALASRLVTGGGYALTLPMIDLSLSKQNAVPQDLWGLISQDWKPAPEEGVTVFLPTSGSILRPALRPR